MNERKESIKETTPSSKCRQEDLNESSLPHKHASGTKFDIGKHSITPYTGLQGVYSDKIESRDTKSSPQCSPIENNSDSRLKSIERAESLERLVSPSLSPISKAATQVGHVWKISSYLYQILELI